MGDDDLHDCLSDTPQSVPTARVRDGCSVSTPGRSGGDRPGVLDVAVHLRHEALRGVEAALAAQAREEGDAQLAGVEVALEVEQVGLDEDAAARDERGPDA